MKLTMAKGALNYEPSRHPSRPPTFPPSLMLQHETKAAPQAQAALCGKPQAQRRVNNNANGIAHGNGPPHPRLLRLQRVQPRVRRSHLLLAGVVRHRLHSPLGCMLRMFIGRPQREEPRHVDQRRENQERQRRQHRREKARRNSHEDHAANDERKRHGKEADDVVIDDGEKQQQHWRKEALRGRQALWVGCKGEEEGAEVAAKKARE